MNPNTRFLFCIILSFSFSYFETHSYFTETAEYLVNDDEDDEKEMIGDVLNAAKETPSLDVSRMRFKAATVNGTMCT